MQLLVGGEFTEIERFDQFGDAYIIRNHSDGADLVVAKPDDIVSVKMTTKELSSYFYNTYIGERK